MTDVSSLTRLMRVFVAALDDLDQGQINQLIAGKARLVFSPIAQTKAKVAGFSSVSQEEVIAKLNQSKDRSEARDILSHVRNRDELATLARAMKVHIVKHDRREDIAAKIIEFVIGGRLRTEAIRTLNLRGGKSPQSEEGDDS